MLGFNLERVLLLLPKSWCCSIFMHLMVLLKRYWFKFHLQRKLHGHGVTKSWSRLVYSSCSGRWPSNMQWLIYSDSNSSLCYEPIAVRKFPCNNLANNYHSFIVVTFLKMVASVDPFLLRCNLYLCTTEVISFGKFLLWKSLEFMQDLINVNDLIKGTKR